MRLGIIITNLFILLFIVYGCKAPLPFKTKSDLKGDWNGEIIKITSPKNNISRFPVDKYGFASLEFNEDDTYAFRLDIIRNVEVGKKFLTGSINKVILKAGYKNFKTGRYSATDSTIALFNNNNVFGNNYKYFFKERTLFTRCKDNENNIWLISWLKDR